MRRSLILTVLLLGGWALVLVGGCSDDDEGTNSVQPTVTEDDSAFVSEFFDPEMFMDVGNSIPISIALLDSIPGGASTPKSTSPWQALQGDDDPIVTAVIHYEYSEGWHIFDFEAVIVDLEVNDTVFILGLDSVQVLYEGTPLQFPNSQSEIDQLKERAHADWHSNTFAENGVVHHALDIALTFPGEDTVVTIGGSAHDTTHIGGGFGNTICEIDISLDQDVSDLQLSTGMQDGDCPLDGDLDMIASLDVFCMGEGTQAADTLDINSTWHLVMVVNENNTITISFSAGDFSWTTTQSCDGSQAAKPYAWNRWGD